VQSLRARGLNLEAIAERVVGDVSNCADDRHKRRFDDPFPPCGCFGFGTLAITVSSIGRSGRIVQALKDGTLIEVQYGNED
jgi:hypothetical protein